MWTVGENDATVNVGRAVFKVEVAEHPIREMFCAPTVRVGLHRRAFILLVGR